MNNSIMEMREAEIMAMPPGPEKDAAWAELARDYEGELGGANRTQDFGAEMAMAPGAQGTNTGATYVAASPLEHLATGLRTYKGFKDMKEARAEQKALSLAKQAALAKMMRAGGAGMGLGGGTAMGMPGRVVP